MKIDYKETTSDLISRINIHDTYGARDIDEWMLETLALKEGLRILDAACGSGKQCASFYTTLNGNCEITGGDVSDELLEKARQRSAERPDLPARRLAFVAQRLGYGGQVFGFGLSQRSYRSAQLRTRLSCPDPQVR